MGEVVAAPEREAGDPLEAAAGLDGLAELAEGQLPLAAHDEVRRAGPRIGVRVGGQARIVATDDDPDAGPEGAHELDEAVRGAALERHHRQPDHVRLLLADEPRDDVAHAILNEDEIGDRDPVVRVDVARERRQGTVRHPDRHRGHVLERVGHRQQEDVHRAAPPPPGPVRFVRIVPPRPSRPIARGPSAGTPGPDTNRRGSSGGAVRVAPVSPVC